MALSVVGTCRQLHVYTYRPIEVASDRLVQLRLACSKRFDMTLLLGEL